MLAPYVCPWDVLGHWQERRIEISKLYYFHTYKFFQLCQCYLLTLMISPDCRANCTSGWAAEAYVILRWPSWSVRWPSWTFVGLRWPSWAYVGLRGVYVGLSWPSFVHFGRRWCTLAVVGLRWPSWAYIGLCEPTLAAFVGSTLAYIGWRWCTLAVVGLCWPSWGLRWPMLAILGARWLSWAYVGHHRLSLAVVSLRWPSWAYFRRRLSTLAGVGLRLDVPCIFTKCVFWLTNCLGIIWQYRYDLVARLTLAEQMGTYGGHPTSSPLHPPVLFLQHNNIIIINVLIFWDPTYEKSSGGRVCLII